MSLRTLEDEFQLTKATKVELYYIYTNHINPFSSTHQQKGANHIKPLEKKH